MTKPRYRFQADDFSGLPKGGLIPQAIQIEAAAIANALLEEWEAASTTVYGEPGGYELWGSQVDMDVNDTHQAILWNQKEINK